MSSISLATIARNAAKDNDPATQKSTGDTGVLHHHLTLALKFQLETCEPVMYLRMLKYNAMALTTDSVETSATTCPLDNLSPAPPVCRRITPASIMTSGNR